MRRTKIPSGQILIFLAILWTSSFRCDQAWSEPVTCVKVFSKPSIFKNESILSAVSTGQAVQISLSDGRKLDVTFLGQQEDVAWLLVAKSREILLVSTHQFTEKAQNLSIPPILEVAKQSGNDCFAHSTLNSLRFLKSIDGLQSESLNRALDGGPEQEKLFTELSNLLTSEAATKIQRKLVARNPRYSLDSGEIYKIQSAMRETFFEKEKIEFQTTGNVNALIKHLSLGYPAIIDIQVQKDKQALVNLSGKSKSVSILKPSMGVTNIGSHSVVAVALIDNKYERQKILVLDSATGFFSLWSVADLKDDMYRFGQFTMLRPFQTRAGTTP